MINTVHVGALEYFTAQNIRTAHCFTTRYGGVSTGYLASLNLGTHRGDDPENVIENFRILGAAVGFRPEDLVLTRQTHTDIVLPVGREQQGAGLFTPPLCECDGLVTNTPGVALAVFTADCTPILLHDPVTGAVGAAHAGWRGTAAAIGAKTVAAMVENYGCKPENIRAAIGPNIAKCCFETDGDVPAAMLEQYGEAARAFIETRGEKYHLDLKGINALSLKRAGVENIDLSRLCTACEPDRFWSHRKVGTRRGSQAGIIVCKEGML